jgi:hypothetical protein
LSLVEAKSLLVETEFKTSLDEHQEQLTNDVELALGEPDNPSER